MGTSTPMIQTALSLRFVFLRLPRFTSKAFCQQFQKEEEEEEDAQFMKVAFLYSVGLFGSSCLPFCHA